MSINEDRVKLSGEGVMQYTVDDNRFLLIELHRFDEEELLLKLMDELLLDNDIKKVEFGLRSVLVALSRLNMVKGRKEAQPMQGIWGESDFTADDYISISGDCVCLRLQTTTLNIPLCELKSGTDIFRWVYQASMLRDMNIHLLRRFYRVSKKVKAGDMEGIPVASVWE